MPVWIMSLTQPPIEAQDLASAVRALQSLLDEEKRLGLRVRPDRVDEKLGTVYYVRGQAGTERYWLSADPPPD